jgi:hypothetical protein
VLNGTGGCAGGLPGMMALSRFIQELAGRPRYTWAAGNKKLTKKVKNNKKW